MPAAIADSVELVAGGVQYTGQVTPLNSIVLFYLYCGQVELQKFTVIDSFVETINGSAHFVLVFQVFHTKYKVSSYAVFAICSPVKLYINAKTLFIWSLL